MDSIAIQTRFPDSILIIDGSPDDETMEMLNDRNFLNLTYYKVLEIDRGLTKQRNFGVKNLPNDSEVISFLDDDTILEFDYFERILETYQVHLEALGVGGYITNETSWKKKTTHKDDISKFCFDGYCRAESSRFKLRRKLNLDTDVDPGFMPTFSHGRSVSFLPPSGKIYPAQQLMGGNCSYRKSVFINNTFSTYFEGYGLYEDADFSIKVQRNGPLFINTAARMEHHHNPSGRPNLYKYGKMVVVNGYYVWRVGYPDPDFNSVLKWYAITILLIIVRFGNVFTTSQKKAAFKEALGRTVGTFKVLFSPPKQQYN